MPPGHFLAWDVSKGSSLPSEVPTDVRPVRRPRSSERRDSPPEVAGRISGVAVGRFVLTQGGLGMLLVFLLSVSALVFVIGEVERRNGALRMSTTAAVLGLSSGSLLPAVTVAIVVLSEGEKVAARTGLPGIDSGDCVFGERAPAVLGRWVLVKVLVLEERIPPMY